MVAMGWEIGKQTLGLKTGVDGERKNVNPDNLPTKRPCSSDTDLRREGTWKGSSR